MDNKMILHTGSDGLEQEYAEYIKDRVGAGACTGLGELGDISSVTEIICIFRYEYKNAALPETVEDLLFERAGELAGKKVRFVGFGERSDGFRQAVAELSDMCGVKVESSFLIESAHILTERKDGKEQRFVFVRELVPEAEEAETPDKMPARTIAEAPVQVSAEAPEKAPAEIPEEAPAEASEEAAAEQAENPREVLSESAAEADEEVSGESAKETAAEDSQETPETYMDEEALAAAIRAVIAESEETISQVTDEVSAEFPDEEEAEDEEPSGESEEGDGGSPEEESRDDSSEIVAKADEEDGEETSREAGGPVSDGRDDSYDDWDPGRSSRSDAQGSPVSFEEPYEERKEEPAGEISPEETVQEKSANDIVGGFSWKLASGEALKTYIRRASGEEPWPEDEHEVPKPEKESKEGAGYRFVDEPVTAAEEAAYEPPLGLSDLEAMEAEEAAEEMNRRERRKERTEREDDPEEGIIARAAARILAFFRGGRDEEDDLGFDEEEKETKPARGKDKSFFEKLREDVGVYDDDEDFRDKETESDYDEDDEEEFEDDEDFSDSFEEDEDEDEF